jgi:hypothetical protein
VQISDIMPLENSAIDAVAVLLVVSKTSNEDSTTNDFDSAGEWQLEDAREVELTLSRRRGVTDGGSNLERFLADLENALVSVPLEDPGPMARQSEAWPRGASQPTSPGGISMTCASASGPVGTEAMPNTSPTPKAASQPIARTDGDSFELSGVDWNDTGASLPSEAASSDLGWITPFCGALILSSLVLGLKAVRKRGGSSRPKAMVRRMPAIAGPHTTNRLNASRSLGSRASRVQDLPPWLARPK